MIKIALFIISISNIFSQTPDERGYIVKVGDKLPEFIMDFPDGSQLNSQDLKGKVTMIQFTASWCHVCREEMPHIEKEIWKVYKKVDLNVVGIDRDESSEVIKKFAKEVKIATCLEFFSIFFSFPLVIKINKAPINGINIIDERMGKFI